MAQRVLITGATMGIGLELARLFARDGYRLSIVARNRERLETAAGELRSISGSAVQVIQADLASAGAAAAVFEQSGPVDCLVNNAGFGTGGAFAEADLDTQLEMIRLNVVSVTELTRRFLDPMIRNKNGRILNVGSVAGFQPGPGMAVYFATKAYVLSFSEALSEELRGTGVTVTVLCPGPTVTGFGERASMNDSRMFQVMPVARAEEVALQGYRAMQRGEAVRITGLVNALLVQADRFAPRAIVRRISRMIISRP